MKTWLTPEVEEISLSNTQYGGQNVNKFDYVYTNAEGNWEGTFVAS